MMIRVQSAIIEVPVPSTHALIYIVEKPGNATTEFVLANVRIDVVGLYSHSRFDVPPVFLLGQTGEAPMTWTLTNRSSDDQPNEVAYFASPSGGTIEPFGEVVVTVVALTRGIAARAPHYTTQFTLFSEDVCVCREQSVEMNIMLVVTAATSAHNSFVELLGSSNVEAAGELKFNIIPVDEEGLRIQDSADIQFKPTLTHVDEAIKIECAVIFLSADDMHQGTCSMPYFLLECVAVARVARVTCTALTLLLLLNTASQAVLLRRFPSRVCLS
jgi:hypothetical protein